MPLDLSQYRSVQSNLFVKIDVPGYSVLAFSDFYKAQTFSGTNYQALGQLVSVTETTSNLRAAPEELTITISGIPAGRVGEILNNKIKGSRVEVLRAFYTTTTGELLNIVGNPAGKFKGVISNYSINDDLTEGGDTGTISIILTATSVVEQLNNKTTGRRTNPLSHREFYTNDASMDRVPALAKSNFNFGAPAQ
jgi:hypothetical protein